MTENEKVIFNREMVEKLGLISIRLLEFMHGEIEKLNLTGKEKVLAHYWVIKHYMDGLQNTLDEIGIKDVSVISRNVRKKEKDI